MLDDLNEFSGGGYILFIYDQNSSPKVHANFDSAAHGLGMQKFMQNWLSLVDNISLESAIDEINSQEDDSGEDFSEKA